LRNILIQLGLHGLILRNEIRSSEFQGLPTGHFETVIAFEEKLKNGPERSREIINQLEMLPTISQMPPKKYSVISGTYSHKKTIRGVAITESNVSASGRRDGSSGKQYGLHDPSFLHRTLQTARQMTEDYVIPTIDTLSMMSKTESSYWPLIF
jgi:hypothetical protein